MKNRLYEFYVTKVTWTFQHVLFTGLTLEIPVDGGHAWIHEATKFWLVGGLIHDLGMLDLCDRVRVLQPR